MDTDLSCFLRYDAIHKMMGKIKEVRKSLQQNVVGKKNNNLPRR